jgi:hypothetical protein
MSDTPLISNPSDDHVAPVEIVSISSILFTGPGGDELTGDEAMRIAAEEKAAMRAERKAEQ